MHHGGTVGRGALEREVDEYELQHGGIYPQESRCRLMHTLLPTIHPHHGCPPPSTYNDFESQRQHVTTSPAKKKEGGSMSGEGGCGGSSR